MVQKISEKHIPNNDIYELIVICDLIIVNDSYQGLFIFDKELTLIKQLYLGKISCEQIFKKFSKDQILLFSTDDENKFFIVVNLITFQIKKILIAGPEYFSPVYWWEDDKILLISPQEMNFFCLDIKKEKFFKITKAYDNNRFSKFFSFFEESMKYNLMQAYPDLYKFTFLNYNTKEVGLFDFNEDEVKTIKNSFNNENYFEMPHDVVYLQNIFGIIAQNYILLRNSNDSIIRSKDNYIVARASFFQENNTLYLIALLNDKFLNLENKIVKYKIG